MAIGTPIILCYGGGGAVIVVAGRKAGLRDVFSRAVAVIFPEQQASFLSNAEPFSP